MKAYRLVGPKIVKGRFVGTQVFEGDVEFQGSITIRKMASSAGSVPDGLVAAAVNGSIVTAEHTTLAHADRLLGISLGNGLIATAGEFELSDPADTGTILFLGPSGTLIDTPPATGFQQQVAVVIAADLAVISLRTAIILA